MCHLRNDHVAIVTFSDTMHFKAHHNKLRAADSGWKEQIKNWVNGESAGGGTVFEIGFHKAFELLHDTMSVEGWGADGTNCQNLILFMTDGQDPGTFLVMKCVAFNLVVIHFYCCNLSRTFCCREVFTWTCSVAWISVIPGRTPSSSRMSLATAPTAQT